MTMTNEELERELKDTQSQLKALRTTLQGDEELIAKWEAGKPNFPNIPEPSRGALAQIMNALDGQSVQMARVSKATDEIFTRIENRLAFTQRLEAFFGPMLQGKNPPLDGAQIADRGYVDEAVARLSRALREEFMNAVATARELTGNLLRQVATWDGKTTSAPIAAVIVADRLRWVYAREMARDAADKERVARPSRLQLLAHLVTGRPLPKNGATS